MEFTKKVIAEMPKCYSLSQLVYNNNNYILAATEKVGDCLLIDMEGKIVDKIWSEPGGVMSLVPVPGENGIFMATHRFYSPNDSADAIIVLAIPKEEGWQITRVAKLPHVHRFDILKTRDKNYLIACALKSGHQHKDDWSSPGKVYAAELPEDVTQLGPDNPLKLEVIKDGLVKNHGYFSFEYEDRQAALVCAEEGIFQIIPPAQSGEKWQVKQLYDQAASDAVYCDLDGDGEDEIVMFQPFHGATLKILKKENGVYTEIFTQQDTYEFLHAIWPTSFDGKNYVVIGHRRAERNLFCLFYDEGAGTYTTTIVDQDCGTANALVFEHDGKKYIAGANRETDQLCFYRWEKKE